MYNLFIVKYIILLNAWNGICYVNIIYPIHKMLYIVSIIIKIHIQGY